MSRVPRIAVLLAAVVLPVCAALLIYVLVSGAAPPRVQVPVRIGEHSSAVPTPSEGSTTPPTQHVPPPPPEDDDHDDGPGDG